MTAVSDILWQNTNNGQAAIWKMQRRPTLIGGGAVQPQSRAELASHRDQATSTHDGHSDILFQNTSRARSRSGR